MARTNSTCARPLRKPYPDFPLTPRADGRWCKRIRGRIHYFLGNSQDALEEYKRVRDDLYAGRTPRPAGSDETTIRDLANAFLTHKDHLVQTGELARQSFLDYRRTCKRLIEILGRNRSTAGLAPSDFAELRVKFAKTMGPVALGNEINRTRIVFKFAYDEELIPTPVKFGQTFKRPSRKTLRKERARAADRTFMSAQIRGLLKIASPQLKAMTLLGINCGLGNSDCGQLLKSHIDLRRRWLDYPRPKTGVERRAKLWDETARAIREIRHRSTDTEFVFLTKRGKSWHKEASDNPISAEFRKLLKKRRIYRKGLGFYSLRHTFATIAREVGDDEATRVVMGHADESMLHNYTHGFPDKRLERIADHVHAWLFDSGRKPR